MKYFGTDGIRGKYNDVITKELCFKLGNTLVKYSNRVVVATDTRASKDELSKWLIDGILNSGGEVIYAGVVPTAALIYYSLINSIVGVMITASHNPYYDNGLKIVNKGIKLGVDIELEIEEELTKDIIFKNYDNILINDDVINCYYNFFNQFKFKSKLNVVVDCANGATYKSAPFILNDICNLKVVANNPDGYNINFGVGSTHLDNVIYHSNNSDIAFSFDGDGDRVLVVCNNRVIDGDLIIYVIAMYLKDNNLLNNNTVVLTKMSNLGILNKLRDNGIDYLLTDVGDKNVVKALIDNNYSIGGENSGHIIIPDILPTGDGLLVAVLLLKILNEYNCSILELIKDIEMYFDKMVNLNVENKEIIDSIEVINKINEIQNKIDGKVIVRKSGTENVVRVSVMSKNKDDLDKYINELVEVIGGVL